MSGTTPSGNWGLTDFTQQDPTSWRGQVDGDLAVAQRLVAGFNPHPSSPAAMTVSLDPGHIFGGASLIEIGAQVTGAITAPTGNPRIDRIVVSRFTGLASVVTGTPAGSPTPPAIPIGTCPVAQVRLEPGQTAIAAVTDERALGLLGAAPILEATSFGADPTGATDSGVALGAWWNAVIQSGFAGRLPAGTYKTASPLVFDYKNRSNGIVIYGDGPGSSVIQSTAATAPAVLFTCSGGTSGAPAGCFYGAIRDLGFATNLAGVGVAFGTAGFADALNSFDIRNVAVANASSNSAAVAVQLNQLLDSDIFLKASGNGAGDAVQMTQAQFNRLAGSIGQAATGLHLTGGYSFGNSIDGLSIAGVGMCVVVDSAKARFNTFRGGHFAWTGYALQASAGQSNVFDNVNFTGSAATVLEGSSGLYVMLRGIGGVPIVTPALPASGTAVSNASGAVQEIYLMGGAITQIAIVPYLGTAFTLTNSAAGSLQHGAVAAGRDDRADLYGQPELAMAAVAMSAGAWTPPNLLQQAQPAWCGAVDGGLTTAQRRADGFAPHAAMPAAMTVALDPGSVFDGVTLTERAAQTVLGFTAPSGNPRIDRVVIDRLTGLARGVTGTAAAQPVPPAIPLGCCPVAQVRLVPGQSAIADTALTDERDVALLGRPITLSATDFGADPTGQTDSQPAFAAWWAAVIQTGFVGYLPAGLYTLATPLVLDYANRPQGVTIHGDGPYNSIVKAETSSGPAVLFTCSGGTVSAPALCGAGAIRDIGFATDLAGIGVAFGRADYADALSGFDIRNVNVTNSSSDSAAVAVQINQLRSSDVQLVANGNTQSSGGGDAVQIRQAVGNRFAGSFGHGFNALRLTGGASVGNLFDALDFEVCQTCLAIDSAGAAYNSFAGGQWVWSTSAINATAGSGTRVNNPNLGVTGTVLQAAVGVLLQGLTLPLLGIATPTPMPASGAATVNECGVMVMVYVYNGDVTEIAVTPVGGSPLALTNAGSAAFNTVTLLPGDSIAVTYTGDPEWVWRPLPFS